VTVKVRGQEAPARDISASGVFFTISPGCELGTKFEFELVFPPGLAGDIAQRIRCRGRAVRVERGRADNRLGVAATIQTYQWIRSAYISRIIVNSILKR
jgi:hypothetical protein